MMNDTAKFMPECASLPVSFKVIGIGTGAADIIEEVKSFGYDCVGCILAKYPTDSIPMDDDKMAIIVARDNEDVANAIAKTYRDAGVLTIGLVLNADISCYDNIAADTNIENFPEIIKHLLLPVVSQGYINYDFSNLRLTLRGFRFFKTLAAEGKTVEEALRALKAKMADCPMPEIGSLSIHLYLNRNRQPALTIKDVSILPNAFASLPESTDVIWSVNFDDTLPNDTIKFTIIISGNNT